MTTSSRRALENKGYVNGMIDASIEFYGKKGATIIDEEDLFVCCYRACSQKLIDYNNNRKTTNKLDKLDTLYVVLFAGDMLTALSRADKEQYIAFMRTNRRRITIYDYDRFIDKLKESRRRHDG